MFRVLVQVLLNKGTREHGEYKSLKGHLNLNSQAACLQACLEIGTSNNYHLGCVCVCAWGGTQIPNAVIRVIWVLNIVDAGNLAPLMSHVPSRFESWSPHTWEPQHRPQNTMILIAYGTSDFREAPKVPAGP